MSNVISKNRRVFLTGGLCTIRAGKREPPYVGIYQERSGTRPDLSGCLPLNKDRYYFTPALAAAAGLICLRAAEAASFTLADGSARALINAGTADCASRPKPWRPLADNSRIPASESCRETVNAGTVTSGLELIRP